MDMNTAIEWIQSTFCYVRLPQNPGHYKLIAGRDVELACAEKIRNILVELEEGVFYMPYHSCPVHR
jgi:hypothetical protein